MEDKTKIPMTADLQKRLLKAMAAGEIDLNAFPEFQAGAFAKFDEFMDGCLQLAKEDREKYDKQTLKN